LTAGGSGATIEKRSPVDGSVLAHVTGASVSDVERTIGAAQRAFIAWRDVPAPKRGDVVRRYAEALRCHQRDLGQLVSLEVGKILAESQGEVQEMIDVCDFATGLSCQLHGLTIASERPGHRMMEQWHPLGVVGIISAFNFPVAVWAWNSALALVAGDATVWKPSEKAPLTAIACIKLAERVCRDCGVDPAIFSLVCGDGAKVGEPLIADSRVALVSATGSTRMGRRVAEVVAKRLGRTLLELGGNNAIVVTASADLTLAVRAILFAAVGTAGQRCTTMRRLIIHQSIHARLTRRLKAAYAQVRIGNPLQPQTLMGPLIDRNAAEGFDRAIREAKEQGGRVLCGGRRLTGQAYSGGFYAMPTLIEAANACPIVQHETFAPILYVMRYRTLDEAIARHNGVPQG
jgi:aldehyde dehydrogenase (NAD+)